LKKVVYQLCWPELQSYVQVLVQKMIYEMGYIMEVTFKEKKIFTDLVSIVTKLNNCVLITSSV
jgi:hypothetical protein